ncbi:1-deoxy-D-xylulose-5-phosphate reductoisomerase [Phaeovibrio sulfidiphilus]|uniref:1-deoxy-D-xylulose 5-phosphate reductoisomerase n=1 Tax=Phaeovibrio sulfidiphilus TaxID=1220600 RepID=A0A8J7CC58_9PROT|nr:1-deoxy-D-xylulose-5-phosphate reductoisomerase [Phaeovibrio sulfidiphilus]MBE1236918.1 1-deoxy-D-xylulose-5-phosphate reductoisomerase [Phaeovibrio sulfidiphilus]
MGTETAKRRVTILGSTGSIGKNTIDLISRNREHYEVVALSANSRARTLAAQAIDLGAKFAAVADPGAYAELKDALSGTGIEAAAGPEAVIEAGAREADWTMAAIVGAAGLEPTLAAVRQGRTVALANKECLVCAGELFMKEVARCGTRLLPVDSEHNAIFQVFDAERVQAIDRLILTASGGAFRDLSLEQMKSVTPEQAVAHPNWSMGAKISVDSASMFNKGLEFIEAYHLFGLPADRIEILVHPQSVIHSMVAYIDGSVLAQLGSPDMRTPIAFCLAYPERMAAPVPRLDLAQLGRLDFRAPDAERFPALRIVREALHQGGVVPTAMNAANEVAVAAFLNREIRFLDIPVVVEATMGEIARTSTTGGTLDSLDTVLAVDREARVCAREKTHALAE